VKAVFDDIENTVGSDTFSHVFQLILTDRGGEFQRPEDIECDSDGVIRTSVYYCDPMCSWQKPRCEKNHEYIRKICPKGTSFDNYTQYHVDRMMSHINSAPRESLGGLTPYALAEMMLSKTLMKAFGLRKIAPDDVILTPDLLKK
jgi:IS30 family transposase